jgi:putative ABC transport system permease protein
VSALDRKLWRDLWQLRGPVIAIAFVIAAGVATFVMFLTTLDSLQLSRASFYNNYRFADVFATLKRAPESVRARIEAIPGVHHVDTRVVAPVTIDIPGFPEPVTGVITSIPDRGEPLLNRLYIKAGRTVEGARDNEVVISEAFAAAHHFKPGDKLAIIIKGKRKELVIVGTAVSPEYIHQLRPGGVFPDYERYGVMWMARTPLASAYDMEGAFNQVVLSLVRGADVDEVIARVDDLLARYGGVGAVARADQSSHRFLSQEFRTLKSLARIFPAIIMGVAAFLLNVVVSRLVGTQREQIATLKAFGYGNGAVALHYFKLVTVIVVLGSAIGVLGGAVLGRWLSAIYTDFFRLPYLTFVLSPAVAINALLISLVAAFAGTWVAVYRSAQLRPAEAMRPEPPAQFRQNPLERLGVERWLSQPTRMILRHLSHRPVKSLLSVLGIAFAVGTLMTGRFQENSVSYMMHLRYGLAQREDVAVTFVDPTSRRAVYDLESLPGVEHAEVFRWVPVRLRFAHRSYRTSIRGMEPHGDLQRLIDEARRRPVNVPAEGVVLTDYLAELLGVRPGDRVTVEVLEGKQMVRDVPVAGVVHQLVGVSAYMDLGALNRLLEEGPAISGAYLAIDPRHANAIYRELKDMPRIAGTVVRKQELKNFHDTMERTMLFFTFVATLFASVVALGIVYNSARITLTERSRDLASLRVLGFTRGEISYILLGELALLTLAAVPLGLFVGRWLCWYIAKSLESDLYRVALVLKPNTYAFAATVTLIAAIVSALAVRRQLDRLDLIGVLKTRE